MKKFKILSVGLGLFTSFSFAFAMDKNPKDRNFKKNYVYTKNNVCTIKSNPIFPLNRNVDYVDYEKISCEKFLEELKNNDFFLNDLTCLIDENNFETYATPPYLEETIVNLFKNQLQFEKDPIIVINCITQFKTPDTHYYKLYLKLNENKNEVLIDKMIKLNENKNTDNYKNSTVHEKEELENLLKEIINFKYKIKKLKRDLKK